MHKQSIFFLLTMSLIFYSIIVSGSTIQIVKFPQDLPAKTATPASLETDDPQPDTILYDDNIGGYIFVGFTDLWADVRFTPVDTFELRAAYLKVSNYFTVTGQAYVYCLTSNPDGTPGTVIAGPVALPETPPNNTWIYAEFPIPITFNPMQEFHLCYGPAPAGEFVWNGGWWNYMDATASVPQRSYFGTGDNIPTEWTAQAMSDYMLRAGGEYDAPTPDMQMTLTPSLPQIVIPPEGGSFDYNIAIVNNSIAAQTFDCWTQAVTPLGVVIPILQANDLTLPGSTSVNRDRTQNIPGSAPAGLYTYYAYVGYYPSTIFSQDSLQFTKSGVDGSAHRGIPQDWTITGESFEESTFTIAAPGDYTFRPPAPNPFNQETLLSFSVPSQQEVSLIVYDVQGREIVRLYNGFAQAGSNEVKFNASGLTSGVYFIRLTALDYSQTQKVLLVK